MSSSVVPSLSLQIKKKLDESGAPTELIEQLHHVKSLFDEQQNWSWNWADVLLTDFQVEKETLQETEQTCLVGIILFFRGD